MCQSGFGRARGVIGIESVDAIVFGDDVDDVVRRSVHREIRNPQRLGVGLSVHRIAEELAELRLVHIARGQCDLRIVLTRTIRVVVVSQSSGVSGNGDRTVCGLLRIGNIGRGNDVSARRGRRRVETGGRDGSSGAVAADNSVHGPCHVRRLNSADGRGVLNGLRCRHGSGFRRHYHRSRKNSRTGQSQRDQRSRIGKVDCDPAWTSRAVGRGKSHTHLT